MIYQHCYIVPFVNIFAHEITLQDYAESGEELNPKKVKHSVLGRHLTNNVVAYFMDYSGLQVETYVPLEDGLAEMSFMITVDLIANLGYDYTDTVYTDFVDEDNGYSGNQLPNSPKSTGNANLTYLHTFNNGELSTTLDYTYRGEWH